MKISKRQLKRIIREEYKRLKRQGLIVENSREEQKAIDMIEYYRSQGMGNEEIYNRMLGAMRFDMQFVGQYLGSY